MEDFVPFEEFIPIAGFEEYGISRNGDIYSYRRNRVMKQSMWGLYKRITLFKDRKCYYLHRHARMIIANGNKDVHHGWVKNSLQYYNDERIYRKNT